MSTGYGAIPLIQHEGPNSSSSGNHADNLVMVHPALKRGHSFCGGCCDMRRAVIIVDCIMIGMLLLDILGVAVLGSEQVDDDNLAQMIADIPTRRLCTIFILEIICCAIAIFGALRYSVYPVFVGLGLYVVAAMMSLFIFNVAGILISVLFAYPHAVFIQEVRVGVMRPETYDSNERQSCCCA
eukprot:CAMPEP_0119566724 /NCGR_PEP_ID=MMETSP1352-20130426/33936_1 /TAXON_ID=265584 /ORGANISM="Stauroneis constricta, Strain CCMP1120" /LENGTH=182 /DNA_ID=CAMNT_0007615883 /DNA_START=157 /DNA_END=705 /DNA_ORIENTATION=-